MRYTNYTNMDARFCRGYRPGDRLVRGWSGDIDVPEGEPKIVTLERLFAIHNRDDRPDGQMCPSMSVGDCVRLTNGTYYSWHTVADVGFEDRLVDTGDLIEDRTWLEVR